MDHQLVRIGPTGGEKDNRNTPYDGRETLDIQFLTKTIKYKKKRKKDGGDGQ